MPANKQLELVYIYGGIFKNLLYGHSMNHSKDNFKNNYLIFQV